MVFIKNLVNHLFGRQRRELPFFIFFAFLITFALSRIVVYATMEGILPENLFLNVGGVHVHHLSYGIFILAVCGYMLLILPDFTNRHKIALSIWYGIGLGLTFDEFGMWIHLVDNYWIRQSYDAIVVVGALLMSVVYFRPFWTSVGRSVYRHWLKWVHHVRVEIDDRGHEVMVHIKERSALDRARRFAKKRRS